MKKLNKLENSMCTPKQAHKAFDEYFDNFDINEIPLDVRKKAIKDYEEIANDAKIVSEEFWIDVQENLKDDIASTKEVVKMLKEKYGMTDYQFKAINPYKVQIVSVSKIPNYLATTNSVLLPLVNKNVNIKSHRSYLEESEYAYPSNFSQSFDSFLEKTVNVTENF